MRHVQFTTTLSLVAVLVAASCGKSPNTGPLSGSVKGTSFNLVGSRTERVDGNTAITLVNIAATCAASVTPTDGQISVDISIPTSMLVPGTYSVGSAVTAGVTKMAKPNGGPVTFDATGFGSGTLIVRSVDTSIQGSVALSADGISLEGTFNVPVCP